MSAEPILELGPVTTAPKLRVITFTEPLLTLPGGALIEEEFVSDLGPAPGSRLGWTEEDLDPTPVPRGCPQCWLRSKGRKEKCHTCPDRIKP